MVKELLSPQILLLILSCIFGILEAVTHTQGILEPKDIVIVIMSQGDFYNAAQAQLLKDDLLHQAQQVKQGTPVIHSFHEDFLHPGAWTILPIISRLHSLHGRNSSWIVFLESRTRINLPRLLKELSVIGAGDKSLIENPSKEGRKVEGVWVGHALFDHEPTIIHHFQNDGRLSYPHFSAGFAIDSTLLYDLAVRVELWGSSEEASDFSIDASHELASFIWNAGQGIRLTHSDAFCLEMEQNKTKNQNCATWLLPFEACDDFKSPDTVYFAVKTCSKFYMDRLPVVKTTWAKYAVHISYFSDTDDPGIPTINLGIPNTEHGHCAKTKAILQHVTNQLKNKTFRNVRWMVLVDDDTILSVARLLSLLSCFRYEESKPMVLGERYGYRVNEPVEVEYPAHIYGYNYATGGGGVALNRKAVELLSDPKLCLCPTPDAPDDMVLLGVCLSRLGIRLTHSSSFHQARPSDYSPKYLASQHLVSFHKHWMVNPLQIYHVWFASSDQKIKLEQSDIHLEL